MKASIKTKLIHLGDRFEELGALLSDPSVISNQNKFRSLSQEYSELEPVLEVFREYRSTEEAAYHQAIGRSSI